MNDGRLGLEEGDFSEGGNSSCAGLMTATTNYVENLTNEIKTNQSHNPEFHGNRKNGKDEVFNGRLKLFRHNMNRWGRKFDNNGCVCSQQVTDQIQGFADDVENQGTGKNFK